MLVSIGCTLTLRQGHTGAFAYGSYGRPLISALCHADHGRNRKPAAHA